MYCPYHKFRDIHKLSFCLQLIICCLFYFFYKNFNFIFVYILPIKLAALTIKVVVNGWRQNIFCMQQPPHQPLLILTWARSLGRRKGPGVLAGDLRRGGPALLNKFNPTIPETCWRCHRDRGTLLHIWWSCASLQLFGKKYAASPPR